MYLVAPDCMADLVTVTRRYCGGIIRHHVTILVWLTFVGNRKRWSEIEMDELKTLFKENLDTLTTPGMKACLKAIQSSKKSNGQLCKRTWETIKKKIWNEIQKLKFNC